MSLRYNFHVQAVQVQVTEPIGLLLICYYVSGVLLSDLTSLYSWNSPFLNLNMKLSVSCVQCLPSIGCRWRSLFLTSVQFGQRWTVPYLKSHYDSSKYCMLFWKLLQSLLKTDFFPCPAGSGNNTSWWLIYHSVFVINETSLFHQLPGGWRACHFNGIGERWTQSTYLSACHSHIVMSRSQDIISHDLDIMAWNVKILR